MASTPKSIVEETLNESWVEVSCGFGSGHSHGTPVSFGPVHNGAMEKLLWEAQKESSHSSAIGSGKSSHKDSPKSPHSPVNEASTPDIFLVAKYPLKEEFNKKITSDWVWDWSSRPDQQPPKEWKFHHPQRTSLSLRHSKVVKRGLFSTEVLSVMVLTNLLSLLLGAGIGVYVGKRCSPNFSTLAHQ